MFAPGLPGTEGAAHTPLEKTELQPSQWRHRVAAQRSGLGVEKSHIFSVWYTDPAVHDSENTHLAGWISRELVKVMVML